MRIYINESNKLSDLFALIKEKILFLEKELILTYDSSAKFKISKEIEELRKTLQRLENGETAEKPDIVQWSIKIDNSYESVTDSLINDVTNSLRVILNEPELEYLSHSSGSIILNYQSSLIGYIKLKKYISNNTLSEQLGLNVLNLSEPVGAIIYTKSTEIQSGLEPTINTFVTDDIEDFNSEKVAKGFLPLVGSIHIPVDDIVHFGFSLICHPNNMPEQSEVIELQEKFRQYFNTFIVVDGDNLHANLSPFEEFSGLPVPLQGTLLGKDLLAQDLVLKEFTAKLLYPESQTGKQFWQEVEKAGCLHKLSEFCLRVWVVPGDEVILKEESDGKTINIKLEKLGGLKVLCETDYISLKKLSHSNQAFNQAEHNQILDIFKQTILPRIEKEVKFGPSFGLLRQVFSVLIMSTWLKRYIGNNAPFFVDSNSTDKYNLKVNGDEHKQIQKEYLKSLKEGVWHYVKQESTDDSETRKKVRLMMAGGIEFKKQQV